MIALVLAANIISQFPPGFSARLWKYDDGIVGVIENNSKSNAAYAAVNCKLYNVAGQVVGTTMTNILALGSGEAWSVNMSTYSWSQRWDHFSCKISADLDPRP